jgi:hypothetical protein
MSDLGLRLTLDISLALIGLLVSIGVFWVIVRQCYANQGRIIGKYLSGLRKLHHVIVLQAGFEAQLRAACRSVSCGMRALGMTCQIGDGRLQGGLQTGDVPTLEGLDQVA